ncbi:pyruvate ferredoxin oxidoreductase [Fervidicoccus fontis]|uniref:2-oxoacid oxidoreductase (ferredoxin) n=1 Tax=Fervidicoccus fontis TaxID=683846 RepID=A0A843A9S1_9CREN|nr:thiamine pyrophosphate-dependent enzyme [Fervidicoccus fontis]MBE9390572.1 pyruvate ferredoxin oxidoreductase [Fervidicoccus fontis]
MSSESKQLKNIFDIPREELFVGGHSMCAGCTAPIIIRHLLKVAGKNTIIVNATGCLEVSTTSFPYTAWKVPWIHVAFENTGAVASGVESAIKAMKMKGILDPNEEINIIAVAGDGGTFDIGFQALSGMLERGHKVMYVLYDNEAYMNTGVQRSGGTPFGAWTTTTPVTKRIRGEWRNKKDIFDIVISHGVKYAAVANPAYTVDMMNKFKKGLEQEGPSFVHVLMPCTTGWRFDPKYGITIARLATETAIWINYEYDNGKLDVTIPVKKRKPVKEYLKMQGRYAHLNDVEISYIQEQVNKKVEEVNKKVGREVIGPLEA